MLDSKDLSCGNAFSDIFEYTTHLTNLGFSCFYITLWVCLFRFALLCKEMQVTGNIILCFNNSVFSVITYIAHASYILTYSHKYILTGVMDIVVSVIMGAVIISKP